MRFMDNAKLCSVERSTKDGKPYHTFSGRCIVTGKQYSVTVPSEELKAFRAGAKIQEAMPSVSAEGREFLLSGKCPEGWQKTFPKEEES